MLNTLSRTWWTPLLRGILSIIFGVLVILFPAEALTALVLVFGVYSLVDGGLTVYHSLAHRDSNTNWAFGLFEGVIGVLAGIAAFLVPVIAGLTLLFVIAAWAVITGAMQIVAAWRLREQIENEFFLGLAGVLSVVFGVYIVFNPLGGAIAVAWLIGLYALIFGGLMIGVAFRYRDLGDRTGEDQGFGEPLRGNV